MNKTQIKKEIEQNSPDTQKADLLKFLNTCKMSNQWQAFTVCKWESTGKYSYEGVRVWTFNTEGLILFTKQD